MNLNDNLDFVKTMKALKLKVELIPRPCWYINVRSQTTPKIWNKIITDVAKKANYKCEICGGVGDKWPVECHEMWQFENDSFDPLYNIQQSMIQKLTGFIALCPLCHACKHLGYAKVSGNYDAAEEHFIKVNNMHDRTAKEHIDLCFKAWSKMSKLKWTIDLSYLDEVGIPYTQIPVKST